MAADVQGHNDKLFTTMITQVVTCFSAATAWRLGWQAPLYPSYCTFFFFNNNQSCVSQKVERNPNFWYAAYINKLSRFLS